MVLLNLLLAIVIALAAFLGSAALTHVWSPALLGIAFVSTFVAGIVYDLATNWVINRFNREDTFRG